MAPKLFTSINIFSIKQNKLDTVSLALIATDLKQNIIRRFNTQTLAITLMSVSSLQQM